LKAIAMEAHGVNSISALAEAWKVPDATLLSHDLEALANALSLVPKLRQSPVRVDFFAWVARWRPHWRYDPGDWTAANARRFLDAVERVYWWLDANRC
jgi:hypothetical protein